MTEPRHLASGEILRGLARAAYLQLEAAGEADRFDNARSSRQLALNVRDYGRF
jgi:hypothetical protein